MTDRELLDLAAKAVGFTLEYIGEQWVGNTDELIPMYYEGKTYHQWNPLDDDGDALRLAVKLFLHIHVYDGFTEAQGDYRPLTEEHYDDPSAATRRAIVRAAAEIGRVMK